MQAPVVTSQVVSSGDHMMEITTRRDVTPGLTPGPFGIEKVIDSVEISAAGITPTPRISRRIEEKTSSGTMITEISPEGRTVVTTQNALGQVDSQQVGDLTLTEFDYWDDGHLHHVSQGDRIATMTYKASSENGAGQLASVATSVSSSETRTVSFDYDATGRVSRQTLPDSRYVDFTYWDNGQIQTITPPDRPYHEFQPGLLGLSSSYIPPQLDSPLDTPSTLYEYNLDRQLARITRPRESSTDSPEQISFDYWQETGLLHTQTTPLGVTTYTYDDDTGQLAEITTPDPTTSSGNVVTTYGYNGELPESETWNWTVSGTVSRAYDNAMRAVSQTVTLGSTPHTITLGYDADDLLKSAGSLTLNRSASTGLIDLHDAQRHAGPVDPERVRADRQLCSLLLHQRPASVFDSSHHDAVL